MKIRLILYATSGLLAAGSPARAGSRGAGSGAGATTIPADTVNGGGGKSTAGSGANAVAVTASVGGIGGTVTAASPAITNQQGYIPQILPALTPPLTGYALWAGTNIPAGRDAAFDGDWNNDGIRNGVAYVFGATPLTAPGKGRIPAPPSIPADVNVYLDRSTTLGASPGWTAVASWVNGAAPAFASGVSIVSAEVRDTITGPRVYYRYRVIKR